MMMAPTWEPFFMRDSICPKCGCKEILSDVKILDRAHLNAPHDLSVAVYANPHALIFRGEVSSPLSAYICSECGFTEFYVDRPKALLKATQDKETKKAKPT
jgi:predicted nucleic-acid-binding Zn-ribbon protein